MSSKVEQFTRTSSLPDYLAENHGMIFGINHEEFERLSGLSKAGTAINAEEFSHVLSKLNHRFIHLIDSLSDAICILDNQGKIEFTNSAFQKLTHETSKSLVGVALGDIITIANQDDDDSNCMMSNLFSVVLNNQSHHHSEELITFRSHDNKVPIQLGVYPFFHDKQVENIVIVIKDLWDIKNALLDNAKNLQKKHPGIEILETTEEYKKISVELEYFETHDNLTGLFNRKYFKNQLEQLMASSKKLKCEHMYMHLDLDQFKVINDACSHVAGDELLRQIAELIQSKVRKWDIVARAGDDEFGLILLYCSKQHALRIAETLQSAIREHEFEWDSIHYSISASIGLVPINGTTESSSEVLTKADTACQLAKDEGRNRVYVFQEEDTHMRDRYGEINSISTINMALEQDKFILYAQVIAPLDDETVGEHYEILVRLVSEDGTLVPPNLFLPAAERYNVITRIDRWVFKHTCMLLNKYPERIESLGKVSINLSSQSLTDQQFCDYVMEVLRAHPVPVDKICFEITETGAIANLSHAMVFINNMRELGISFALDDFGTGLSSFAYLKNLPVDYVKIDGIFVKDIAKSDVDTAMVKSINEIGHVMGKKTIAEFVEDKDAIEKLKQLGVDFAQGYGIAKPELFEEYLK